MYSPSVVYPGYASEMSLYSVYKWKYGGQIISCNPSYFYNDS